MSSLTCGYNREDLKIVEHSSAQITDAKMKDLLFAPIALSIILGLMIQLVDVAESVSDKTIKYAKDMENALDCAFAGVNIGVCSPDLVKTDFTPELLQTQEFLGVMQDTANDELEAYNISSGELMDYDELKEYLAQLQTVIAELEAQQTEEIQ